MTVARPRITAISATLAPPCCAPLESSLAPPLFRVMVAYVIVRSSLALSVLPGTAASLLPPTLRVYSMSTLTGPTPISRVRRNSLASFPCGCPPSPSLRGLPTRGARIDASATRASAPVAGSRIDTMSPLTTSATSAMKDLLLPKAPPPAAAAAACGGAYAFHRPRRPALAVRSDERRRSRRSGCSMAADHSAILPRPKPSTCASPVACSLPHPPPAPRQTAASPGGCRTCRRPQARWSRRAAGRATDSVWPRGRAFPP